MPWPRSPGLLRWCHGNRVIGARAAGAWGKHVSHVSERAAFTTALDDFPHGCQTTKGCGVKFRLHPPAFPPLTSAAANRRAVPCRTMAGVAETRFVRSAAVRAGLWPVRTQPLTFAMPPANQIKPVRQLSLDCKSRITKLQMISIALLWLSTSSFGLVFCGLLAMALH